MDSFTSYHGIHPKVFLHHPIPSYTTSSTRRQAHPLYPHGTHQARKHPLTHFSLLIHHIISKIALPHTFPFSSATSGKPPPAPHCTLHHIPIFPMYHIRSKIGLTHTFPSSSVTSGAETPFHTLIPPHPSHQEMGAQKVGAH